ncbi:MAG: RNA methyltransferase [Acidimicrobiia bacterium]
MEPVRSTRNPRVAEAVRLHRVRERRQFGLTLIEGPHLLTEARAGGADIVRVFGIGPAGDDPTWIEVTQEVLDRLAGTENPRGPVAVIRIPPTAAVKRDHLSIDVGDPGNGGTLIRTAAAFSLDVVFRPGSVDPWAPKVLRAAAGAHFRTSIGEIRPDVGTIATVARGGVAADRLVDVLDPARTWSILVGSEPHGLAPEEVEAADVAMTIPMPGEIESLNAAVAGSIVAYEFARWRNSAGPSAESR